MSPSFFIAGTAKSTLPVWLQFQELADYLINQGFEASFGDGLALEAQVSSAANGRVSADDVEARRRAVLNRGRAQAQ